MDSKNTELYVNTDTCYRKAEQRAADYFKILEQQVLEKSFVPSLIKDIQSWKQNHIQHPLLSLFSKSEPDSKNYNSYIRWLDSAGKLDDYLDRSVSYLFMRDLGKALDEPDTQNRIRTVIESLKGQLTRSNSSDHLFDFSMDRIYRWAQKEGIETTIIWLFEKLKTVSSHLPEGMDAEQAKRKLIKIIAGVLMNVIEEMDENLSPDGRSQKLDEAIRLGYSYGLTYPFIDDILDANVLSDNEKKHHSDMIRNTLMTGTVPELGEWAQNNLDLIQYIHSELREAFEYIKGHQLPETMQAFMEQSYVFFQSQEVDRIKELSNPSYTNEELYIPIILKSSSSRLIVRSVIGATEDKGFDHRTFYYGIYNQLADDFADMFADSEDGAVTPYTYYLKYHHQRKDLINPFELYWTVISHLIHHVYHSDPKTREVILDRVINGLKRFKKRAGLDQYRKVMDLFASGIPALDRVVQQMVKKADDVDFFDKLLRDHMIATFKKDRMEQEEFLETIKSVRNQINNILDIPKKQNDHLLAQPIIDAANYSLQIGGKRLRPIITWVMAVYEYRLNQEAIVPLLRSLEYMHTASLIFDDLPSQDNASIRRGQPTLHRVYNSAVAELTGLFLTQKAIEEQASLDGFDAKTVLRLIQYSAKVTEVMCQGQAMDLNSKGKPLTLEQLNSMCFYKTGIAFEAALVMPAILAHEKESEIEALKKFAHHAGVAFQIKDDLLDVEGEQSILGKEIGKDSTNNNTTFVSILGVDNASKRMWEHYCLAIETLQQLPTKTTFLKQLMNYIVHRDR
ncbi:polyprenyl synthetase family protein [Neobacillus sp. K501]